MGGHFNPVPDLGYVPAIPLYVRKKERPRLVPSSFLLPCGWEALRLYTRSSSERRLISRGRDGPNEWTESAFGGTSITRMSDVTNTVMNGGDAT